MCGAGGGVGWAEVCAFVAVVIDGGCCKCVTGGSELAVTGTGPL